MKTILLVSELGGGLGHIAPLLKLGERLLGDWSSSKRLRVILATASPVQAKTAFPDSQIPAIAAPVSASVSRLESRAGGYGEILTLLGFSRRDVLEPAIAAWEDLYELLRPHLIIADHSPIACLAARDAIPVVAIGSGFTLPPHHTRQFPSLRSDVAPPMAQKQVLDTANAVLSRRGRRPLPALPEIFAVERRAVFTLPMLDPYGSLRQEPLLGSYHAGLAPSPVPDEPSIFIYAGGAPERLDAMVHSLGRLKVKMSAYLASRQSAAAQLLRNRGVRVYESPPPLDEVLSSCSTVISHGGSGLANAALTVGRPQIIVPIHMESQITAGRISALGVGLAVEDHLEESLGKAVEAIQADTGYRRNAEALAEQIGAAGLPGDPIGQVAAEALKLLA